MIDSVALLMYHSVADSTTRSFARWTVDPRRFEEHLAALAGAGAEFLTVAQAADRMARRTGAHARLAVAITIDDALADISTGAAPALEKHGATATIFVPTAFVGAEAGWLRGEDRDRPVLDWDGLRALAKAGAEIGSHGHQHLACDVNPVDLVERDACCSRDAIGEQLGRAPSSFAFPFGFGPPAARQAIRRAGFDQAVVVSDRVARTGDDRYALPRLEIGPGVTGESLLALVRRRPGAIGRGWSNTKQRVWTAGRRYAGWGPPEAGRVAAPEATVR
jgi:peptidoglycan/xylan/chitin deacetylase (PgdA/CDA1 family)